MEYAIVDIETTGGYAAGSGITEIAIRIFNGEQVIDSYETLVQPRHKIPLYITALTGIDYDMVCDSPAFEDIAKEVFEMLNGRVFVAHNVNFDEISFGRGRQLLRCTKIVYRTWDNEGVIPAMLKKGSETIISTQDRLTFKPLPEEIVEFTVPHLLNAPFPIISFGQGCEGEPLLMWETIRKSIIDIRKYTQRKH
ncbi:MAG: exonuclease domain-containing protein [Arachidicoccus sp.]|nr:exonuclease domain-containing protein [Arachidicoccus sp.]